MPATKKYHSYAAMFFASSFWRQTPVEEYIPGCTSRVKARMRIKCNVLCSLVLYYVFPFRPLSIPFGSFLLGSWAGVALAAWPLCYARFCVNQRNARDGNGFEATLFENERSTYIRNGDLREASGYASLAALITTEHIDAGSRTD